jgi:hypothetical protein
VTWQMFRPKFLIIYSQNCHNGNVSGQANWGDVYRDDVRSQSEGVGAQPT